ncbi:hypothetical protein BX600DRAFT_472734 [Xylariales sp. PMI_506]|nr:hypothetical protein BX600DRAFT_472734 [Xylariales sp. PMI_506]
MYCILHNALLFLACFGVGSSCSWPPVENQTKPHPRPNHLSSTTRLIHLCGKRDYKISMLRLRSRHVPWRQPHGYSYMIMP